QGAKAELLRQDSALIPGPAEAGDGFGTAAAFGDFKGDGRTDLAIGIPGKTVGGHQQAGEVIVLYGTGSRQPPYFSSAQVVTADTISKLAGGAQGGDEFGMSLAAARFSGSGYTGLAIGIPGRTVDGTSKAGTVVVLHGGPDGLAGDGAQILDAR